MAQSFQTAVQPPSDSSEWKGKKIGDARRGPLLDVVELQHDAVLFRQRL
jgi:hypothetical protein